MVVQAHATRRAPEVFRISEPIDADEWRWLLRKGYTSVDLIRLLRAKMIDRLAKHLADNCRAFQLDYETIMRDQVLHIEVSIDDLGAYKHLAVDAERAGRRAGIEEAIKAMPYGLNEVYE